MPKAHSIRVRHSSICLQRNSSANDHLAVDKSTSATPTFASCSRSCDDVYGVSAKVADATARHRHCQLRLCPDLFLLLRFPVSTLRSFVGLRRLLLGDAGLLLSSFVLALSVMLSSCAVGLSCVFMMLSCFIMCILRHILSSASYDLTTNSFCTLSAPAIWEALAPMAFFSSSVWTGPFKVTMPSRTMTLILCA